MPELYSNMLYFMIYAFFGWCLEVVYQALEHGHFINRGFLNGPYCPIYGFGVILVTGALEPLKGNLIILFAGSVILTSALELLTGFVLEKIFHMQWWDYSKERLNVGGYICLKFSLLWGVACIVTVRLIHPAVESFVASLPHFLGMTAITVFLIGFTSDMIVTVAAIVHIRQRITLINDISSQMRKISDKTGEHIFDAVETAKSKKDELDELSEAQKAKFNELRAKYKAAYENKGYYMKRIEKAFPKLSFDADNSFRQQLSKLKEEFNSHINNKH